ncbi:Mitochondrial glycoprotein [Heracleum sosnowskyi]|uniref:Mitochondrial glycoprotein n=1 Tax=Heracleum sosnowskyi TaxID=360622 RepID=A0AAD8I4M9_9APIA|nr:Mitochondrial glycoprotein [Heracleum sosnowskyi]
MALPSLLRRSVSRAAPLAARFLSGQSNLPTHTPSLYAVVQSNLAARVVAPTSFRSYSASSSALKTTNTSDQTLVKVIDAEIVCAEESDENPEVLEAPEGFLFKIEDVPGQQTITLSRKHQDETITVEVHMPDLVTGEDDNEDDDDDDDEKPTQSHVPLVVKVAKSHKFILEFNVTAYPDEISIDSISIKKPDSAEDEIAYEGPDFSDLDENLQKAFHKYLEIRGVKPSTTNFLHEYMINKDSREYMMWLKNLKKFVQA